MQESDPIPGRLTSPPAHHLPTGVFLNLTDAQTPVWGADDYPAILRHQLEAPLEGGREGSSSAPTALPAIRSLADLLAQPNPSLGLLRQAKDFARAQLDCPTSLYPRPVAAVLYHACIAAAWVRCQHRITSLDDTGFRAAVAWATAQPWLCEPLTSLFRSTCTRLSHQRFDEAEDAPTSSPSNC
jgi:hypothetical protein